MNKATMSQEQAQHFDTVSLHNMMLVQASLSCACKPYKDVFTYDRWLAQGQQVQKGQHGIKLSTIKEVVKEDGKGGEEVKKIFTNTRVFCRCQVKPCEGVK